MPIQRYDFCPDIFLPRNVVSRTIRCLVPIRPDHIIPTAVLTLGAACTAGYRMYSWIQLYILEAGIPRPPPVPFLHATRFQRCPRFDSPELRATVGWRKMQ
eukprot:gene16282-biopygen20260